MRIRCRAGVAEGTRVKVLERYTGGARVQLDGIEIEVAMQNIDSGRDVNLNGQWLDEHDRRVIKEQRRQERAGLALRRID